MYIKSVGGIDIRKRLDLWEVPEEKPSMQTLSRNIIYNLSTCSGESDLFDKAMIVPVKN